MSYSEQYKEHIEYTFATFCKILLRNTALSAKSNISISFRQVKNSKAKEGRQG